MISMIRLIVTLLVVLSFNSYANTVVCNSQDPFNFIESKSIKFIDISTPKSKKWTKNYFKALKSPGKTIVERYKKRFDADLKILFNNGLECSFPAKIRISGDYKEHIGSTPPVASLDVKLLAGNVDSIVKFKLFIPKTKGSVDEVFSTALLNELGFLTPKTYLVPAIFNGQEFTFLYQEKISKEFIESRYFREAPILEGDERFIYSDTVVKSVDTQTFDRYGLARVVNKNWAEKGETSLEISKLALEQLNKFYIDYLSKKYADNRLGTELLRADILSGYEIHRGGEFKALMLAIGAEHALWPHNRNFYYDPMYRHFKVVYYDGNSAVTRPYIFLTDTTKSRLNSDEIFGSSVALKSLERLDTKQLQKKIAELGLKYSLAEVNLIVNQVRENLKTIRDSVAVDRHKYSNASYFSNFGNIESGKKLAFSTKSVNRIEVCNFSLSSCYHTAISLKDYSKLVSGRYADSSGNSYIYIGNKSDYSTGDREKNTTSEQELFITGSTKLITYDSSNISINQKERLIQIQPMNAYGRFLIKGGALNGWSIELTKALAATSIPDKQRFNENLLTGCLTLMDVEMKNLSVSVDGASCEDGVNFVRANGNVSELHIRDAGSDAIDADFSKIDFKKIRVNKARNDCVDLSSGVYKIESADLFMCQDKGISVGEGAKLIIDSATISESEIGLASKDSSIVTVKALDAVNSNTCFAAYNKKQEFWGGVIKVASHNCGNDQFSQDESSSIIKILK